MRIWSVIFVGLTLNAACIDGNKGSSLDSAPAVGFISAEDIRKPDRLQPMSPMEAEVSIQDATLMFLATVPDDTTTAGGEGMDSEGTPDCLLNAFEVKAQGDRLTVGANLDLTSCLQSQLEQSGGGVSFRVLAYRVKYFLTLTCKGQDLSSFDGKPLTLSDVDCGAGSIWSGMDAVSEVEITFGDQSARQSARTLSLTAGQGNQPCQITAEGEQLKMEACLEVTKSEQSSPEVETPLQSYQHYMKKNLLWQPLNGYSWYSSGSIEFVRDSWAGSMNYSGAQTNPTYTMTDGVESRAGVLSLPLSLRGASNKLAADVLLPLQAAWKEQRRLYIRHMK